MDKITSLENLKINLTDLEKELMGESGQTFSSVWNDMVHKKLVEHHERIKSEHEKKVSFSTQVRKSTKDRLDEYIHKTKRVESISDFVDRGINNELQRMLHIQETDEDK